MFEPWRTWVDQLWPNAEKLSKNVLQVVSSQKNGMPFGRKTSDPFMTMRLLNKHWLQGFFLMERKVQVLPNPSFLSHLAPRFFFSLNWKSSLRWKVQVPKYLRISHLLVWTESWNCLKADQTAETKCYMAESALRSLISWIINTICPKFAATKTLFSENPLFCHYASIISIWKLLCHLSPVSWTIGQLSSTSCCRSIVFQPTAKFFSRCSIFPPSYMTVSCLCLHFQEYLNVVNFAFIREIKQKNYSQDL